jgi:uroporphyrinogen-III synthase
VGARTAGAARAAGFVAIEGPGTAEGLSALILAQHPAGRIVHARGAEAALPLAQALAAAGLPAQEAIIYRQESAALSPEAAPLWVAAISDAAAQPGAALHPARLEIAARPDLEGVLAAMSRCLGDLPG